MPAPITHIAFSLKLLENRLPRMNRRLFLQGTLFPDIRYLGLLEREDTHLPLENLSVLAKDEPFTAGMKFHNFIDQLRQQWLAREDVYAAIGPLPYKGLLTKFYEDYIFYQHVADWKPLKSSLNRVSSEERRFGIPDSMVMLWHYLLKLYFRTPPDDTTLLMVCRFLKIPASETGKLRKTFTELKNNPTIPPKLHDLWQSF